MPSFGDTFDGPVAVKLGDGDEAQVLHVPKATISDYQEWCAEITTEFRTKSKMSIPANLPPMERYNLLRQIETTEATPEDVIPYLFTPAGITRLLKIVIRKTGKTAEEAQQVIDGFTFDEAKELAMRASGLFPKRRLLEAFGPRKPDGNGQAGGADPLAGQPSAPAPPENPNRLTFA